MRWPIEHTPVSILRWGFHLWTQACGSAARRTQRVERISFLTTHDGGSAGRVSRLRLRQEGTGKWPAMLRRRQLIRVSPADSSMTRYVEICPQGEELKMHAASARAPIAVHRAREEWKVPIKPAPIVEALGLRWSVRCSAGRAAVLTHTVRHFLPRRPRRATG